jgi:hypothetical protein
LTDVVEVAEGAGLTIEIAKAQSFAKKLLCDFAAFAAAPRLTLRTLLSLLHFKF